MLFFVPCPLSLQLTELFQLERDMFCTAINFVDRYLSIRRIDHLYQLQKLGACALMIAAKFVGSAPLAVDDLCGLMDNIFSPAELKVCPLARARALRPSGGPPTCLLFFFRPCLQTCCAKIGGAQARPAAVWP